ncbi:MAG: adenylate/guanylate cyclase domain-containing protein, partial [Acidobacteriota bacterium]
IGLDIFLSETRLTNDDKAMQDALTSAGVVILASQAPNGTLPLVKPLTTFCQPEVPNAASGFCVEGAPGALGYAFVNMPIEADGFVRQANLFSAGTPPTESFPLMLAQQYSGQSIQPGDREHALFLNRKIHYSDPDLKTILIGTWGRQPATIVPAWQVLDGIVPASAFADKAILIGQSSDAARDTHFTPLFRLTGPDGVRLRMGGTSVQAAAVRSLLEAKAVRPAPFPVRVLFIFLASLMAAFFVLDTNLGLGFGRMIAIMALWFGISLLLYARWRYWLPFLPAELGMGITLPITLGLRFVEERLVSREAHAQREQMMSLFSSYVDPAVAETIWNRRSELSLGGEERIATVMFTDIRGFTALSANQPPAHVLHWLNRYLTAMDEVIREHGGFLNKFIGDGLMIIFGLPLSQGTKDDAIRAVKAALAMVERVDRLNLEPNTDHLPQLRIGAGIHTGSLMAGSIGSATRQEYSVIGETVNLASRLESLNKQFHTEILMSVETRDMIADSFPDLIALGDAKVAGLEVPVSIYTLPRTPPASTPSATQESPQ